MPRKRRSRVYWRNGRAWGDFRDFADVGGRLERLVAEGATLATTDADIANTLADDRVKELEARRRGKALTGVERESGLASFAEYHLIRKADAGRVTDTELAKLQHQLERAVAFLGGRRLLTTISVRDIERWAAHLSTLPGRGGRKLAAETIRKHLSALSNLYRRAAAEGSVPPGFNPAAAMMDKPSPAAEEARWLEVHEAALLLEAARIHTPDRDDEIQELYPLLATFLLTGGRKAEVLGLAVEDVSFDRGTVTFRPHQWRRLKTRTSRRVVPLWPQLHEILQVYMFGGDSPRTSGLLFPSCRTGKMLNDIRKALNGAAERAGWNAGDITTKMLRHTYSSARLQTLDGGAPVSPFTVAREMGHGGLALVNRVYGHLGTVRHRSEHVEFRVEQHQAKLGERLAAVRAWTPPRCKATTAGGERCKVRGKLGPDGLCLWHDPKRAEQARKARPHARR